MHISNFLIFALCGIKAESAEKYQIRSRIELINVKETLHDTKDDIKDEVEQLFCKDDRLKFEGATDCDLKDLDFSNAEDSDNTLSGDVQFLVEIKIPASLGKSDLKSHYETEIKDIKKTTTQVVTSTEAPTETTSAQETTKTTGEITTTPVVPETTTPSATTETSVETTKSTSTSTYPTTTASTSTMSSTTTTRTTAVTTTTASTTTTTTPTTTKTTLTTGQPDGSGEGSGVDAIDVDLFDSIPTRFRREFQYEEGEFSGDDFEYEYKFIDIGTLEPDSFVICVGECKDEGFWMLIAFVSTAGFCILTGLLSCQVGSPRARTMSSAFSALLLLGLMGGMIYVGVVEKVGWNYAGGYLGMRPYSHTH